MARAAVHKLTVMISSTVYGKEALLDQIFAMLRGYGYRVWCSHSGTVPIVPGQHAYESCLAAVEGCDIFLNLISQDYGSGTDGEGGPTITHRELDKAIALDKPRFILAHEQVVSGRRFLMDLGLNTPEERTKLTLKKGAVTMTDLRLIEMYEAATQEGVPVAERRNNWVQKYRTDNDVLLYVEEQFSRYDDLKALVDRLAAEKGGPA